ncbi:hypothetical protein [Mycolicibacterium mageritense]|uniref:hypothetical protein n=1 Tax=Mycolicibacterium mageritense TaxID=53462 RepID=UPI0011D5483C|nr:hypothetical protein [Mycolicibacterium mageritense]TXI57441.1 MAG: hypothetical protein E6Q55_26270 [Mycolicibacterium mageritense]
MTIYHEPNEIEPAEAGVREAVRFGLTAAGVGVGALAFAAVWASTCTGGVADSVACGAPERTLLAIIGPVILLIAGLRALVPTPKRHGAPRAWQATGWILVALTAVLLVVAVPALTGPVTTL